MLKIRPFNFILFCNNFKWMIKEFGLKIRNKISRWANYNKVFNIQYKISQCNQTTVFIIILSYDKMWTTNYLQECFALLSINKRGILRQR